MKLDEAAAILGVSVDADLELLKQTHRKLALAWHPDKVQHYHKLLLIPIVMFFFNLYYSVRIQELKKSSNKYLLLTQN